jgi:hypothetical protein
MENITYLQRVKTLLIKVLKIDGLLALLLTALAIVLYSQSYLADRYIIFAVLIFFLIIIPISVVVLLGGTLISSILFLHKKRISSASAGFLGTIIGTALVLIANYVNWFLYYPPGYTYNRISFFEFIFPKISGGLGEFVFLVNPLFVPSLINIFVLAYIGWEINNLISTETDS